VLPAGGRHPRNAARQGAAIGHDGRAGTGDTSASRLRAARGIHGPGRAAAGRGTAAQRGRRPDLRRSQGAHHRQRGGRRSRAPPRGAADPGTAGHGPIAAWSRT
jgi:hypothetical protein